jgi:hypothetical protein
MKEDAMKRPRWVGLMLVILPLWLVVSGVAALWYFQHREKKLAKVEQARFARTVSEASLTDDLKKLVEIIGERNGSSESAAKNLSRAAAMIEGTLGPSNTGYTIRRDRGPAEWPLIQVTLRGKNANAPAVWVLASYDSRPGSVGVDANATGLAATLAAAQAMASDQPEADVRFIFLPHANDPESPILETATKLKNIAANPKTILCVEAMGAGDELWLSSRDTDALPFSKIHGLGSVRGADVICLGDDADLSSVLFEIGLPAARVATRPLVGADEADAKLPATVAASAGRLVELIRRCARVR